MALAIPSRLAELETVIEHGRATFSEVGHALMEIRDSRLYRVTHKTFEDYCRERWDMGRAYANRLIAASVQVALAPVGAKPKTERGAREARREIAGPQPIEVANLVKHVDAIDKIRGNLRARPAADRLKTRSRSAFARRLRKVGTYLGSIALAIEEEGKTA
jgi:hypothetical protein